MSAKFSSHNNFFIFNSFLFYFLNYESMITHLRDLEYTEQSHI